MESNYVTFRKFGDLGEARALARFLIDNGIDCHLSDTSAQMGTAMVGELNREYEVQLKPEDFEAAGKLIEANAEKQLVELPEDYYLLTFTDEELYGVVLKHDEWSEFDYLLARRLLAERGKTIDEDNIQRMKNERLADLAKPEPDQTAWVIVGYVLALLGALLGIITGYVLLTAKKTLPDGSVVPTYSKRDRMHGKFIVLLGVVVLVLIILWRFFISADS